MKNLLFIPIIILSLFISCIENPLLKKEKSVFEIKGSFETISTILSDPPIQQVKITGEGTVSHLGKTTFEAQSTLTLIPPPPFSLTGSSVMKAANGDEIHTTAEGTSVPQDGGLVLVTINHTIIGGTGRFEEATGSFVGVTLTDRADPAGFLTIEGTISY